MSRADRQAEPGEAEWTSMPAGRGPRLFPYIFYGTLLVVIARLFPEYSAQARTLLGAAAITLAALIWRGRLVERKHAYALQGFLEGSATATHCPVRVDFARQDSESNHYIWHEYGAMIVEDDFLAFSSRSVCFLMGGQDLAKPKGFRFAPNRRWQIEIGFARNPKDYLEIRVLDTCGVTSDIKSEFLRNLYRLMSDQPRTDEKRSLPPTKMPTKRGISALQK